MTFWDAKAGAAARLDKLDCEAVLLKGDRESELHAQVCFACSASRCQCGLVIKSLCTPTQDSHCQGHMTSEH